jgi:hypothetical protein
MESVHTISQNDRWEHCVEQEDDSVEVNILSSNKSPPGSGGLLLSRASKYNPLQNVNSLTTF